MLFHSVTVEPGATVRYSILMPGTVVKAGATVDYAIVAENAVIGQRRHRGHCRHPAASPGDWGITVVAQDIEVGDGAVVPANAMITRNVKGGAAK